MGKQGGVNWKGTALRGVAQSLFVMSMSLRGGLRRESVEIPTKQSPVEWGHLAARRLPRTDHFAHRPRNDMKLITFNLVFNRKDFQRRSQRTWSRENKFNGFRFPGLDLFWQARRTAPQIQWRPILLC
jgi:hypothetical protein